jgi:hypothetical protein
MLVCKRDNGNVEKLDKLKVRKRTDPSDPFLFALYLITKCAHWNEAVLVETKRIVCMLVRKREHGQNENRPNRARVIKRTDYSDPLFLSCVLPSSH